MTCAWVIGSSGLLGSALCRALNRDSVRLFFHSERFCWDDWPLLEAQIATSVTLFASQLEATDKWEVYWSAGVGTMSSTADSMATETRALTCMLQQLTANKRLSETGGAIVFASSAGAIYAESSGDIITENTTPTPTTAYAHEKIRQENIVRTIVDGHPRITALIARISSIYGSGQSSDKKQGLLTHIARCILRNQPIQIYVPYDTIRDYIYVDDAAEMMIASLHYIHWEIPVITKIIASERPATIAEIISIFKRIARRSPRIVTSASKLSRLYSHRVQFRSIVQSAQPIKSPKSLVHGVFQLLRAERAAYVNASSEKVS